MNSSLKRKASKSLSKEAVTPTPTLRLINRANMDSLPPEAFLRFTEFFDIALEEFKDGQPVNADDEEKVRHDLELLEGFLADFKPVFLERKDPSKIIDEVHRNKKIKKTSM